MAFISVLAVLAAVRLATSATTPSASSVGSDLTLLFQNDLNCTWDQFFYSVVQ